MSGTVSTRDFRNLAEEYVGLLASEIRPAMGLFKAGEAYLCTIDLGRFDGRSFAITIQFSSDRATERSEEVAKKHCYETTVSLDLDENQLVVTYSWRTAADRLNLVSKEGGELIIADANGNHLDIGELAKRILRPTFNSFGRSE